MSTQPNEPIDDTTTPPADDGGDNSAIRAIREQANKLPAVQAEAAAALERAQKAEQRAALLELGVKPDSPQGKKLLKLHGGDWTADALRSTATEYGESLPGAATITPDEAAQAQRMAAVGQGSESTDEVSDFQRDLDKLPKYGDEGWGSHGFHDVLTRHGGRVVRQRLTQAEAKMRNPFTGELMKGGQDTPVTTPRPSE